MNFKRSAGLLALLALFGGATQAADMADRELGLLLGVGKSDRDLVGGKNSEANPLFGFRYGSSWGEASNFFGDFVFGKYEGDLAGTGDVEQMSVRGGVEWLISRQDSHDWFVSTGVGATRFSPDVGDSLTRGLLSLGLGQAWEVGANDSLRWEVRAEQVLGGGLPSASAVTQFQALVGYSWGLGAPKDTDGDGVANRGDQCANTPASARVDPNGCPIDSDNDKVFDGLDKCPGTPDGAKVDGEGCPLDSDKDGVADYLDRCPDTPAGMRVGAEGCPLDSDKDGIADHLDRCPMEAAPGTADGCVPPPAPAAAPAPMPPKKRLILKDVFFEFNNAKLRESSIHKLDDVAASLGDWGEVRIEVAGHTDITGPTLANQKLSQARAEAVRDYLIAKGIAAERLVAVGYGETRPVADNKTSTGRAENRRVELNEIATEQKEADPAPQ